MSSQKTSTQLHPSTGPNASSDKRRVPLISGIRVDHGPSELLGTFFIRADAALRDRGIHLYFGTFDELAEVNLANRDSWKPLNPTFDPACGLVEPGSAFALLGVDRAGQVVTAGAIKVFDWRRSNFKLEAESLRFLYAEPNMAPKGAACRVSAPSGGQLSGIVGYGGAGWLHPSVRKSGITPILSRVARAWAYTKWGVDLVCGISALGLIGKGFIDRNGYRHIEAGVHFENLDACPPEAGLVWITASELLDDLRSFMDGLGGSDETLSTTDDERKDQSRIAHGDSAA